MFDYLKDIAKAAGLPVTSLIILIIALIITGTWVVLIPVFLIVVLYYLVDALIDSKLLSTIASYYGTSVIMSVCALLIFYFPNTIGGGLFEAG